MDLLVTQDNFQFTSHSPLAPGSFHSDDTRALCGHTAVVRLDLVPLVAWARVLEPSSDLVWLAGHEDVVAVAVHVVHGPCSLVVDYVVRHGGVVGVEVDRARLCQAVGGALVDAQGPIAVGLVSLALLVVDSVEPAGVASTEDNVRP